MARTDKPRIGSAAWWVEEGDYWRQKIAAGDRPDKAREYLELCEAGRELAERRALDGKPIARQKGGE